MASIRDTLLASLFPPWASAKGSVSTGAGGAFDGLSARQFLSATHHQGAHRFQDSSVHRAASARAFSPPSGTAGGAGADTHSDTPAGAPAGSHSGGGSSSGKPQQIDWSSLDKGKFFVYNPLTFFLLRSLQHPANLVKTRYMVTRNASLNASPWQTLSTTLRLEGVPGLYRGFSTVLALTGLHQIFYISYEYLRSAEQWTGSGLFRRVDEFDEYTGDNSVFSEDRSAAGPRSHLFPLPGEAVRNLVASSLSVFVMQVLSNPVDVIASRQMLQGQRSSHEAASSRGGNRPSFFSAPSAPATAASPAILNARQIAALVYRTKGLGGFYAGFWVSNAQFVPSTAIWWYCYTEYRNALFAALQTAVNTPGPAVHAAVPAGSALSALPAAEGSDPASPFRRVLSLVSPGRMSEILGGAMAGATVALATNPLDIIRTRAQSEGEGAVRVVTTLLKEEGVKGFWRGTTARLAMLVPHGALSIWAYEMVKRLSLKTPPECKDAQR